MEIDSKPEEMDRLDRRIDSAQDRARGAEQGETTTASKKRLDTSKSSIDELEQEYADLEEIWKAEKAAVQGTSHDQGGARAGPPSSWRPRIAPDLARMSELQYGRIPELERQLEIAAEAEQQDMQLLRNKVTDEEVAEVVSKWTGIPVAKMLEGERDKLLRMEEVMRGAGGRPGRGRRARSPTRSGARARGCPIRTGRTARSCSSVPPASARPS